MDKKALRAEIRRQKAAMTPAQIQGCSRELTRMALASPLYEAARSIYGYLPYNQGERFCVIQPGGKSSFARYDAYLYNSAA